MLGHGVLFPIEKYGNDVYRPELIIGNDVYVGAYCQLHCIGGIFIGDGVVLSDHVYVSDVAHGLLPDAGPIMKQKLTTKGPVHIGDGSFVGYGASILPGVKIGVHCVVGTRAVVTKSFPAYSMIAGSPAKLVGYYNEKTKNWERHKAEIIPEQR